MGLFSGVHKLNTLYNILRHFLRSVEKSDGTMLKGDTYMTIRKLTNYTQEKEYTCIV